MKRNTELLNILKEKQEGWLNSIQSTREMVLSNLAMISQVPSETFKEDLDKLDKDKAYFIYCRSGNRSGRAMPIMKELGFKEVYNLSVGIQEWIAEGLPIIK